MKQFFILLLLLLLIILSISYYTYCIAFRAPKRTCFEQYTLPDKEQYVPHHPTMKRCLDELLAVSYEEIYITSFDHKKLFGRYYPAQKNAPIHLLFHGYKSNPYLEFCGGSKLIADLGHNAIIVDQRAHGKSEGNTITFGINERRDVISWIHYCTKRFGEDIPIFLWGLSMGAATVLMAGDLNLPSNVKGILADCPFSSPKEIIQKVSKDMHFPPKVVYPFIRLGARLFGHFNLEESSAESTLKNNHIPILLFHGDDDRFVPCSMSHKLKSVCPDLVTFELIPTAGHGLCYMVSPEKYRNSILKFIETVQK